MVSARNAPPTFVEFGNDLPADTTALVEFDNGSGTLVGVVPGFVASIVLDKADVVSIEYTPSLEGGRPIPDQDYGRRLAQIRANAAAASRLGALRADTPEGARILIDSIRVGKGVDLSLSMYAAYAFEQAGLRNETRAAAAIMRRDLGVLLFDLALLSSIEPVRTTARGGFVTPFCPMLSQGWNYIHASGAVVPEQVLRARKYLRQALWTTFNPPGIQILAESGLFGGS